MRQRCPDCDNIYSSFASFESANGKCHHCHGAGEYSSMAFGIEQKCTECHGTGICQTCHGGGEADIHNTLLDEPLFSISDTPNVSETSSTISGASSYDNAPGAASTLYSSAYDGDSYSSSPSTSVGASPKAAPLPAEPSERWAFGIFYGMIGGLIGAALGWIPAGAATIVLGIGSSIIRHGISNKAADNLFTALWIIIGLIASGCGFLEGYYNRFQR